MPLYKCNGILDAQNVLIPWPRDRVVLRLFLLLAVALIGSCKFRDSWNAIAKKCWASRKNIEGIATGELSLVSITSSVITPVLIGIVDADPHKQLNGVSTSNWWEIYRGLSNPGDQFQPWGQRTFHFFRTWSEFAINSWQCISGCISSLLFGDDFVIKNPRDNVIGSSSANVFYSGLHVACAESVFNIANEWFQKFRRTAIDY